MGTLNVLACLFIYCYVVCEATALQNEGMHQSDTHDLGTILKVVEKLEKRVDVLEAENAQQRLEIAELKAYVEREQKDHTEATDGKATPDESIQTDSDHTVGQKRDTGHRDINRIRRAYPEVPIAFFARLSGHAHHLGRNQNVAFDNVVTNVGNAYDHNFGMFKAPVGGVYVFSTTLMTYERNHTHCGFMLNNHTLTEMVLTGDDNTYDSDSQTIVLQLKPGDDVSLQHFDTDRSLYGGSFSMFSGFLLSTNVDGAGIIG